jgi:16S rRNA (guanine527-N7)-methyltransferase
VEQDEAAFRASLAAAAPGLSASTLDALCLHHQELRRWNERFSLVGPSAESELVARHYAEALAALPVLGPRGGTALDLGSGAGFPGWVLAAAAPRYAMTLTEANGAKAAFLRTTARRCGLEMRVLDVRVEIPLSPALPEAVDLLTIRALRLTRRVADALAERLTPDGRWLFWAPSATVVPPRLRIVEERPLGGRERRLLVAAP